MGLRQRISSWRAGDSEARAKARARRRQRAREDAAAAEQKALRREKAPRRPSAEAAKAGLGEGADEPRRQPPADAEPSRQGGAGERRRGDAASGGGGARRRARASSARSRLGRGRGREARRARWSSSRCSCGWRPPSSSAGSCSGPGCGSCSRCCARSGGAAAAALRFGERHVTPARAVAAVGARRDRRARRLAVARLPLGQRRRRRLLGHGRQRRPAAARSTARSPGTPTPG